MLEIIKDILYYPILNLLTFLIWATPGHYIAVAIVLATLIIRFALLIPSKRAAQSQRKLNQLQPLLEELKREYGDDRQGLATAQMELYKKNDINPFGSCLPTLIQFPIIIALYTAIREGIGTVSPNIYHWVPVSSVINSNFFGINLLQVDKYFILPICAAALQYVQICLTLPPAPKKVEGVQADPTVAAQRGMLYIIPFMTLFIAYRLPAGVALYWVATTIFSIFQQRQVNKEKFNLTGVTKALKEVDTKHPEHKPRTAKVEEEIAEETSNKKGVSVTVRKKK